MLLGFNFVQVIVIYVANSSQILFWWLIIELLEINSKARKIIPILSWKVYVLLLTTLYFAIAMSFLSIVRVPNKKGDIFVARNSS